MKILVESQNCFYQMYEQKNGKWFGERRFHVDEEAKVLSAATENSDVVG